MDTKQFLKYAGMFAAGAYAQHKYTQHQVFRDPGFIAVLDAALEGVPQEEIDELVRLSPDRLRDWAMAPRTMRPALLRKWKLEPSISPLQRLDDKLKPVADWLEKKEEGSRNSLRTFSIIAACFLCVVGTVGFFAIPFKNFEETGAFLALVLMGLSISIAGIVGSRRRR